MRLKTKLVLAITGLVFAVVVFFSWMWLSQMLQQHIQESWSFADFQAHEVLFEVQTALDAGLPQRHFDPRDPAAVEAAVAETLRQDPGLNSQLTAIENYSPTVLDVAVVDSQGRALVTAPDATLEGQTLPNRPDYGGLLNQSLIKTLRIVFGPPRVYDVTRGLDLDNKPFLSVRIGINITFLRNAFHPWLVESVWFIGLAMVISIVVAAFVANLALHPIEQISRRLDALDAQEALAEDSARREMLRSAETPPLAQPIPERTGQATRSLRFPARSSAWASAFATSRKCSPLCARTSTRSSRTCRTA